MSTRAIRNLGGLDFLVLSGHFVVRGNLQPDGDTIAFAASSSYDAQGVRSNIPVNNDGTKTVSIRLQSIDAPEKKQPLGSESRDALLRALGFNPSALGLSSDDFTAAGAPVLQTGWVATHGLDGNRRPLGYVFASNPSGWKHGQIIPASEVLSSLKACENYRQVARGQAYPAFYQNSDEEHAVLFAKAASRARDASKGVWRTDQTTTGFIPVRAELLSGGALVHPKFFRRVEKWKSATPNARAFITWLKSQKDGKKLVSGAEFEPVELWKLFQAIDRSHVAVPYDTTKLWFSE
jgi:hypothetical protein